MKRESPEEQRKQMLEAPIPGLIGRLAVPTIISMLVTSIYNMADTYFVSHIGAGDGATSASGAVSIVFSLMAIIQAVGFTVGGEHHLPAAGEGMERAGGPVRIQRRHSGTGAGAAAHVRLLRLDR